MIVSGGRKPDPSLRALDDPLREEGNRILRCARSTIVSGERKPDPSLRARAARFAQSLP